MPSNSDLKIAVLPGDGIGHEIMPACLELLRRVQSKRGGFELTFQEIDAGADYYRRTGIDITDEDYKTVEAADAILFGAMGLPDVRFDDGTEIAPHLRMRDDFGLYAGVRPVKQFPNAPQRLADPRAARVDFVVLRESTEGLFFSRGKGEVIGDSEARETLRITRKTSEKLFDFAFRLARRRKEKGSRGMVTCVDKSNVFRAYAFFRKIFDERKVHFPDIEAGYSYVDAQALDLIRRPWDFDVLVMENMFADILSDLGGGLVGGMGMAPCGEIGDAHALFQPAHGSAPDIAGQDKANPTAMFLSAALMLDWLAERHGIDALAEAAVMIENAVYEGFASGRINPVEFGGTTGTSEQTRAIVDLLDAA